MTDTTTPPWMFTLDGTFLGFMGDDLAKAKFIRLEVDGEVFTVKVRKELRERLRSHLQPGDYLRCIGRSELDDDAIKLKAHQVFTLLPPRPKPRPYGTTPELVSPALASSSPAAIKAAIKIQVCRKSGCQKRGGQQIAVALEQALRDRNLQHQVEIQYTGCQKHCSEAPTFTVSPGRHRYSRVKVARLPAILDRHLAPYQAHPRARLMLIAPIAAPPKAAQTAPTPEPYFDYFAYGSCMCPVDLKRSLGENTYPYVVGPATLKGYRLGFHYYSPQRQCGALDIVPAPGHEVQGVLYRLPWRLSPHLDQREGVQQNNYRHEYVTVHRGSRSHRWVRTYAVVQKTPTEVAPNDWYFSVVLRGAITCQLPETYCWQLFQHMRSLQMA